MLCRVAKQTSDDAREQRRWQVSEFVSSEVSSLVNVSSCEAKLSEAELNFLFSASHFFFSSSRQGLERVVARRLDASLSKRTKDELLLKRYSRKPQSKGLT